MFEDGLYAGHFLSNEDILAIHEDILVRSEVDDDAGFIDQDGSLFESASASIFAGFGGIELYKTVEEKAARLCFSIISNHCFLNANKRTGLMAMLATLEMNGIKIKYDEDEMFKMICGIGSKAIDYTMFREYINSCIVKENIKKVIV